MLADVSFCVIFVIWHHYYKCGMICQVVGVYCNFLTWSIFNIHLFHIKLSSFTFEQLCHLLALYWVYRFWFCLTYICIAMNLIVWNSKFEFVKKVKTTDISSLFSSLFKLQKRNWCTYIRCSVPNGHNHSIIRWVVIKRVKLTDRSKSSPLLHYNKYQCKR